MKLRIGFVTPKCDRKSLLRLRTDIFSFLLVLGISFVINKFATMADNQELILRLLECDVLKLGNFKLKSGDFSPIYVDLRRIIHYPQIVKDIASVIRAKQMEENLQMDTVCGVPYTAIPIASVFSVLYNIPMVMKRKEAKDYGTKRIVEGVFKTGNSCLLIEDIVCSGTSIMETVEALRREGLKVDHCVVIINKGQGGIENLKELGITVHPLLHINSIFDVYCSVNRIEAEIVKKISSYFKDNSYLPIFRENTDFTLCYSKKAEINHPVAKRLLEIMDEKKTNLCVAIDVHHCDELIKLTEQLGPHICLLKTHIDILKDFSEESVAELRKLSYAHNFLIMEDRKFADIGNTVIQQYTEGMYKIETWADLVTVQAIPGSGTIEALKLSSKVDKQACILTAEIGTDDMFICKDHIESAFQVANKHADFVIGYVAQQMHPKAKNMIYMCSCINIPLSENYQTPNYKLPEEAIGSGADIIIVGKEIYKAADIVASAIEYKTRSFNAYLNRIS